MSPPASVRRAAPSSAAAERSPSRAAAAAARSAAGMARARARSLGVQARVAAGQREAVAVADGGHRGDADREVEVGNQASDDDELLGVLLAEVGDIGQHRAQQLGDDRCDAAEVSAAPHGSLEAVGQSAEHLDARREAVGVKLGHRRREQQRAAGLGGQPRVLGLVARIAGQVGRLVELRGVDEQADDDQVALGGGPADQRQVALVQRAHGRHEPDRARAGRARLRELLTQLGDGAHDPHALLAVVGGGGLIVSVQFP